TIPPPTPRWSPATRSSAAAACSSQMRRPSCPRSWLWSPSCSSSSGCRRRWTSLRRWCPPSVERHPLDGEHAGVALVDCDLEPLVDGGGPLDGHAREVRGGCGHAVERQPARSAGERLVLVVDVAVAVEQEHGTVEPGRLFGDGADDGLEGVVVG